MPRLRSRSTGTPADPTAPDVASDTHAGANPWARRGILAAAVVYVALSGATALTVLPFRPADESANVGYVMSLVTEHRIPYARDVAPKDLPGQRHVRQHTAKHPPLYYVLQTPVFGLSAAIERPMWGLFAGRLLSSLFGAAAVALVGLTALEATAHRRTGAPVAASIYAATLTPFVVVGGLIHNDTLSAMWSSLALFGLARILARGYDHRAFGAVVVGCSAGLLTRAQAVGVLTVCLLGLIAAAAALERDTWSWRGLERGLRRAAVLGVACLVTSGWFYLYNFRLYGDPTGGIAAATRSDRAERGLPFRQLVVDWRIWLSMILDVRARLGHPWRATDLRLSLVVLGLVVAGVAAGTARTATAWWRRRRVPTRTATIAALLALVAAEMVVMAIRHLISGGALHNRYMFPAIAAVATGAGLALLALPGGRRGGFVVAVALTQVGITAAYVGHVISTGLPPELAAQVPTAPLDRLVFGLRANGVPWPTAFLALTAGLLATGLSLAALSLWHLGGRTPSTRQRSS